MSHRCVHMHIHACTHAQCTFIYIHTHARMYTHIQTYIYTLTEHTRTCMQTHRDTERNLPCIAEGEYEKLKPGLSQRPGCFNGGLRWVSSSPNLGFLSLNKGRKADEPMTLDKGVPCPSLALDLWELSTV